MMDIKRTLDSKICERERTLYFFLRVPPHATFPELLGLDYQIASLRKVAGRTHQEVMKAARRACLQKAQPPIRHSTE
jgi:hypothetical protein